MRGRFAPKPAMIPNGFNGLVAMEESLADMCLELGECWLRKGWLSEATSYFEETGSEFPGAAASGHRARTGWGSSAASSGGDQAGGRE